MQKYLFLLLLVLFYSRSYAQFPKIDHQFRDKIVEQEARHYQQMMLCEQQKTLNQEDYDVTYYALDLTPDPATSVLCGTVEVVGEVTADGLSLVELNFWDGMTITDVHVADNPSVQLNYTGANDLLSVELNRNYLHGEEFRLVITYNGQPQNSAYASFGFGIQDEKTMIWTLSEPFGARAWWPCKDVPSDKADSVDIRVTVPSGLIVASNGTLRETITEGEYTTYWWHEQYPIVSYLVFTAIYPYEVHYDDYLYNGGTDTMKIHFYNFAGNFDRDYDLNVKVKDMIACFSQLFGEYPFIEEKYGQADFIGPGAMEHQTCSSFHGSGLEEACVHELAHQWWGDMITCNSFHHIWLNEGFARYSEALWYEYAYPPLTASEYQMSVLYLGSGTIYVENPETEKIFDGNLSYNKASWVLHMLRHVVGDDIFFDIIKSYYSSPLYQYGTATTEEFQAVCEQVSCMNLNKFFHQWIYEEYCPCYFYSWNWIQNGSEYDIELEIQQTQTNYIFWMPIDITISTVNGDTTFVVWDSLPTQSFKLSVSAEPIGLEIDKNNWILKIIVENIVNPTFDQGILLVNGVSFSQYGSSIWDAYENRAFWGDFPISFWNCINDVPVGGYPSTLPEPLGSGKVPYEILGQFSTVIWVGNDYFGDLDCWLQTWILPYLETGGNLILLTRRGQNFITGKLQQYLGISWADNPDITINNCLAVYPGLQDMTLTGDQTYNAVFDTNLINDESTLLFKETASFSVARGLGVWRKPTAGGTYRSDGGQFVFISGRPYRYDPEQLRPNIEYIIKNFFHESPNGINNTGDDILINNYKLNQNYPNPFNPNTTISYDLPLPSHVLLQVYDVQGREVVTLVNEKLNAGSHMASWNAAGFASGVYLYRLQAGKYSETKKLVVMK